MSRNCLKGATMGTLFCVPCEGLGGCYYRQPEDPKPDCLCDHGYPCEKDLIRMAATAIIRVNI